MSKKQARSPESYQNEEMVLELVPAVLTASGFSGVAIRKHGQVKLIEAVAASGRTLRFWLKQGWTGNPKFAAVQFGMFAGEGGAHIPDDRFLQFVDSRVARIKALGATHALFVHMAGDFIRNWAALVIDDVSVAYHLQMAGWPHRARNTKAATLWFEDDRAVDGADCALVVRQLETSLAALAGSPGAPVEDPSSNNEGAGPASRKVTVDMERRMKQAAFRLRLGNHYGWRCAVSG